MIYIYRRAASDSARDLADALNDANIPARRTQGGLLREQRVQERLTNGRDRLICWGDTSPLQAPHVLNGGAIQNKLRDAETLAAAGIKTITTSRLLRPQDRPAGRPDFVLANDHQGQNEFRLNEQQAQRMAGLLQAYLAAPLPPAETWLARLNSHVGGNDLLNPRGADFWVRKEDIREEFRIHSFLGKSIRAGRKMQREFRPDGVTPSHEWIRSFDAGWIIAYEEFKSSKAMRDLAAGAVQALGLQFGAVDIAKLADNSLMVLEVNRAPGIEGGTVEAYVRAIQGWING